MGNIQVPGRLSGRSYNITIKGDTPSPTEQARIRQFVDEQESAFASQYESTFGRPLNVDDGTAIGRGWERGKASAYSRLGSAVEYLGSGVGIDALRDVGQNMRKSGDTESFLESMRQPAPTEWENVHGPNSFLTWAGEQLGQTAPETGAVMAASTVGELIGGPLAGLAAGAVTISPTTFGGNVQRQEAEVAAGRRDKVDVGAALKATVGQSILESIADRLLLKGLVKPGAGIFTRAVGGAVEGSATEGLTEVGQQVLERWQAGLPLDDDQAMKEYEQSLAAGAVIGGTIRGGTAAVGIGVERKDTGTTGSARDRVPAAKPREPGTPPVTVNGTNNVTSGGEKFTIINLSNGQKLTVPGHKPKDSAEVTAAVDAYNGNPTDAPEATPADTVAGVAEAAAPQATTAPQDEEDQAARDAWAESVLDEVPNDPTVEPTVVEEPAATEAKAPIAPTGTAPTTPTPILAPESDDDFDVIEGESKPASKPKKPKKVAEADLPDDVRKAKQIVEWTKDPSIETLQDEMGVDIPTAVMLLDALEVAGVVTAEDIYRRRKLVGALIPNKEAEAAYMADRLAEQDVVQPVAQPAPAPVVEPVATFAPREEMLSEEDAFELAAQNAAPRVEEAPNAVIDDAVTSRTGVGADSGQSSDAQGDTLAGDNGTGDVAASDDGAVGSGATSSENADDGAGEQPPALNEPPIPNPLQNEQAVVDAFLADPATPLTDAQLISLPKELLADEPQPILKGQKAAQRKKLMEGWTQRQAARRTLRKMQKDALKRRANKKLTYPGYNAMPGTRGITAKDSTRATTASNMLTDARGRQRLSPSAFVLGNRGRRFTGNITEAWKEWLEQRAATAEASNDPVRGAAAAEAIAVWFKEKAPEAYRKYHDWISKTNYARPQDRTTHIDKETVATLLKTRNATFGDKRKEAAWQFFARFPNIAEALEEMGATAQVGRTRKDASEEAALEKELPPTLANRFNVERFGAAAFYKGLDKATAVRAVEWVSDNLSPAAQATISRAAESVKIKATTALSTSAGLSAANTATKNTQTQIRADSKMERQSRHIERETARAYRKQLRDQSMSAQVKKAAEEVRLAAGEPTGKARPMEDIRLLRYKPGETRTDAIIRYLERTNTITDNSTDAEVLAAVAEVEAAIEATNNYFGERLSLPGFAVDAMALPLTPSVEAASRAGDLTTVLTAIAATHPNSAVAFIASRLAGATGSTKLEVVTGLTNSRGERVGGLFDPKTNTVLVDSELGMNAHTHVHEMSHAALSHILADAAHPTTIAVQEIFDSVKDQLGTVYGSTNLQEFAAEALSNVEFRGKLARLHANGDPISAWTRFSTAVLNYLRKLVGLPAKTINTALTASDNVLLAALAPAPDARDAGALYMESSADSAEDRMAIVSATRKLLEQNPDTKAKLTDAALDMMYRGEDMATKLYLIQQNLGMLGELAKKAGMPVGEDIVRTINAMHGAVATRTSRIDGNSKDFAETRASVKEAEYEAFMEMMNLANFAEVTPLKPKGSYTQPSQVAAHDKVLAMWAALNPKLKHMAKALWAYYPQQLNELIKVLNGAIDNLVTIDGSAVDAKAKETLKASFLGRLAMAAATKDGFQPMVRKGDYWLTFSAKATPTSPPEVVYKVFESQAARKRAMAALAKMPEIVKDAAGNPVFDTSTRLSPRLFRTAPDGSFVQSTLRLLDAANVTDDVKEQFMNMVVELLPETSFAKSLQQREGYPGAIYDPLEAFNIRAPSIARQIERLRYTRELREQSQKLMEDWNRTRNEATKPLAEELSLRAKFAMNPPADAVAEAITRTTFTFTLAANTSSVVVQTASVPVVVLPNLAARYGTRASISAIAAATKRFAGSGLSRFQDLAIAVGGKTSTKVRGTPSLDNYYVFVPNTDPKTPENPGAYKVRDDLDLTPEQIADLEEDIPLIQEMSDQGALSRSLFFDSFGIEAAGRERSFWSRVNTIMGGAFHIAERMNRQVTAHAAYKLELAKLRKLNPNMPKAEMQAQAAKKAVHLSIKLNGGHSLNSAPRLTQQGWGRVLGMFRNYGLHIANMQLEYAIEACGYRVRQFQQQLDAGIIPSTPENLAHLAQLREDAKVALKATLGMWGSSFLLAGVAGVPMFNAVAMMVNALLLGDDEDDFETIVRKHIGEGWYKGWLTELSGMDVSSRIGLSGLLLRADRFNSNPSEADTLLHTFGGPAWATFTRFKRGATEILSGGDMQRGIEQMLPAGLANILKAGRYATEGMTTRRGDPVVADVSAADVLGQLLGFAPTSYTLNQERNQVLKRIDTAINTKRTKLMKAVYLAESMNNSGAKARAMEAIREFNRKHPTNPIEPEDLKKSLRQHEKTTSEMYNGIVLTPSNKSALELSGADWHRGWTLF